MVVNFELAKGVNCVRFMQPIEVMTDMSKSRKLGFTVYQDTEETFYDLLKQLREAKLIS